MPTTAPAAYNSDGTAVCRHRDLSVCPTCAADPRYVAVYGRHYWIPDERERRALLDLLEFDIEIPADLDNDLT